MNSSKLLAAVRLQLKANAMLKRKNVQQDEWEAAHKAADKALRAAMRTKGSA